MQKNNVALIVVSLSLFISACQPKADNSDTRSPSTQDNEEITKQRDTQIPVDILEPKMVAGEAIMAKDCVALNQTMQKIDGNSKIEAINSIQELLNSCLPTASNAEVLTLLENYQDLYKRFLGADVYMDDQAFYHVVETMDADKKVSKQQLEMLSPRIQYLIKLVEKKADVSILYIGEGIFVFHHDLQKMAEIFSPFLPKDQQAFIERMAQDNQDIFWNDAAIDISFNQVIARAQFWQDYIQRYPKNLLRFVP